MALADAICSSFGSKPLLKSSPFLSHYTSPKPFFLLPSISFKHSFHTKRTRERRPPLQFTCLCTSSSPDFDVILTHENSDGSFMFRFGDPSEVVRNDPLEEADLGVEGKGSEDEDAFSVTKIMGSDIMREGTVKKIEGEEKSEDSVGVVDDTSSVIERESRSVFEIESSSGETSSSSSIGVQKLVSSSSLDICDFSEITEEVDGFLHRRVNIELNNSVGFDVEDFVHVDGSIERNGSSGSGTQVENVVSGGECLAENDDYESPAALSPSPPDDVSGPEDQGTSAEIVSPLSGVCEELISLELDHVVEVTRDSDHDKEQPIRNDVDQREVSVSLSPSEFGSGPDDHESPVEITEPLTGRNQELVSAKLDSVIEVPADDVVEETSQERTEVEHVLNIVDFTNEKSKTQNKNTIGDSSKSEIIQMLSLCSPLETEPTLHEEGNAENVEAGTKNDIMGGTSEREVIGAFPFSSPLEAEMVVGEGEAKNEEIKSQDDVLVGGCGREVTGALLVSLPFGPEPVLEGGDTIGEVGSHNITDSSSESEGIETLPSDSESVLGEGAAKVMKAGTQDNIMEVNNASEVIGILPMSPPLEAEPFLFEEGDAGKVESGTENDIKGDSSESEIILTLPLPPPLEVQPVPDNEAELKRTEILNESFRSGTEIVINTSSEIMEVQVNKEIATTDEPVDSSDNVKTVSIPIIPDLQSEKICLDLFLSSGTASLPHPEKALAGGEDACFTCQNWLGVADGISHWSLEGVDHGKYAHEVMEIACEIVSDRCDTLVTSPDEVLNLAVVRAHYPGFSTVLISHFDGQDLHVANIGDSGIIILRNDAVCQRTSPMFHDYNFPVLVQREDDSSKLVERYKFNLDEGDIVVAATDGFFDNLYEQDIISIVSKSLEAGKNPKEIAEILATRAHEVGASTRTRSPFSDAAQAAGYTGCTGGKLDDVVVVVSLVKKGFDSHAS